LRRGGTGGKRKVGGLEEDQLESVFLNLLATNIIRKGMSNRGK
jgi:hypothetical protein